MINTKKITVFGRNYYISPEGKVFNQFGKEMTKHSGREYPYVEIRHKTNKGMERKKIFCHRLVAELFIPNPLNLPQVNHIDGNKNNCDISNLEWVSAGENQLHSRYTLNNMTGFNDTPVLCVDTGTTYLSTRDAWRNTGINYSHISECANGKRKTAGGYRWKKVAV